jgi:hypothetical protein
MRLACLGMWDHAKVVREADALDVIPVIGVEHDGVAGAVFARNGSSGLGQQLLIGPMQSIRQRWFVGPGECIRKDKALKIRMELFVIAIVCLPLSPTNLITSVCG